MSIRVPRATMADRGQPGAAPSSTETSGRAAIATTALTGTSSSTVQLTSAADVRSACTIGRPRASGPGQHRHHHGGERPAHHDVVDDVRHHVRGGVGGAEALSLHGVREHHLPAEADHPRQHGDRADQQRGSAYSPDSPDPSPSTPPLGHRDGHSSGGARSVFSAERSVVKAPLNFAGSPRWAGIKTLGISTGGRRPSMSSQRRADVRSITLVKLTFSLAAVRPVIPASRAIRAGRGRPAAATPSMAPSAFAPQSPSMARSARSSGRRLSPAASGAATSARRPPRDPPAASSAPEATATLTARPGRRSNRLSRFAPPATSAPLMTTSTGAPPASAALATPVTPMPPSLIAPVVISPRRRAPRWPRNPRRSPDPARSS